MAGHRYIHHICACFYAYAVTDLIIAKASFFPTKSNFEHPSDASF